MNRKEYAAKWYRANRERALERSRAHYYANYAKSRAVRDAYRAKNKDKMAALTKAWKQKNKERIRVQTEAWRLLYSPCILGCGRGTDSRSGVCPSCRRRPCTKCGRSFLPPRWKQESHWKCPSP